MTYQFPYHEKAECNNGHCKAHFPHGIYGMASKSRASMNGIQLFRMLEDLSNRGIVLEEIEILAEIDGFHVVTDFRYQEREGLKELITVAQTRVPFDWRTIRLHTHIHSTLITAECLHPDCGFVAHFESNDRMDAIMQICEQHPCWKRREKDAD